MSIPRWEQIHLRHEAEISRQSPEIPEVVQGGPWDPVPLTNERLEVSQPRLNLEERTERKYPEHVRIDDASNSYQHVLKPEVIRAGIWVVDEPAVTFEEREPSLDRAARDPFAVQAELPADFGGRKPCLPPREKRQ
jgi:hypothetical protein